MAYFCQDCARSFMCIISSHLPNLNYAWDFLSVSMESAHALRLVPGKDSGQVTWVRADVIEIVEDTS